MADWHNDPSCRRPDIITSGGISSCLSCGSIQPGPDTASPDSRGEGDVGVIYQPLKAKTDTRLLSLEPGEFEDPVRCSLSLSNTADLIEYDAISYTWGGEDNTMAKTGHIWLGSHKFAVTPNCEAALRRVRARWTRKVIWIDAVCMNQEDVSERGHQVRLMPQIYTRARHVRIYLGEPCPEEEMLLRLLAGKVLDPGPLRYRRCKALMTLFSRRYFSRVWILQEVALAKQATIICGGHSLPWSLLHTSQLLEALGLIDEGQFSRLPATFRIPSVIQFRAPKYRDPGELLHLLDLARHSFATDPRDKVFAVFGLISCPESDGLSADYTKTTREVFMQIAEWIAQRFGLPALLARTINIDRFPEQGPEDNSTLPGGLNWIPSWAPNWTEMSFQRLSPMLAQIHEESRTAPGRVRLPVRVVWSTNTIAFPVFKGGSGWPVIKKFNHEPRYLSSRSQLQWTRSVESQLYLLPEPGEYDGFSFTEPGSVSIYATESSFTWIHENGSGQKTIGRFSKYALCGQDLVCGYVLLQELCELQKIPHHQDWGVGQFEVVEAVSDDCLHLFPEQDFSLT